MSTVLCLLAHPDDEIFCAGLLGHLSDRGMRVHLTYLTRGEGGVTPVLEGTSPSEIADIREEEALCAAQVLGAARISFLDYVDPAPSDGLLKPPEHTPEALLRDIRTLIEHSSPEFVLTHGSNGEYGHPAHTLLHATAKQALRGLSTPAPALYSFNAFYPSLPQRGPLNDDDWADVIVDVSSVLATKRQVFDCHRTQWAVFVGHHDSSEHTQAAIDAYVRGSALESYCQHEVAGHAPPAPPLFEWLETTGGLPVTHTATSVMDRVRRWRHWGRLHLARTARDTRTRLSAVAKRLRPTRLPRSLPPRA